MSEINYIFDSNTLCLYNIWENRPLDILAQSQYSDSIKGLTEHQVKQYTFWLSLHASQRSHMEEKITHRHTNLIVETNIQTASNDRISTYFEKW